MHRDNHGPLQQAVQEGKIQGIHLPPGLAARVRKAAPATPSHFSLSNHFMSFSAFPGRKGHPAGRELFIPGAPVKKCDER